MKFITIQNQIGEIVAINPERITYITMAHEAVVMFLGNDESVFTKFTDIKSAVDYVERATKDRSGWFSKVIDWNLDEDEL